jgi:hypothetical protein
LELLFFFYVILGDCLAAKRAPNVVNFVYFEF